MAKRLAIEWDSRELRIVAGTIRGDRVTISDVISVAIESAEPQALGETLKRVLAEAGLDKLAGGVALGRGKTELRELKLPPVPDAELPDMVRFQAIRSFATASEKSAIDYIPTRTDSDGIRVVAASVSPEELKRCALIAVPSHTSVERLVLRPMAAANLYRSRNRGQAGETILIDLLADDADIVVLRDDIPVFVRSIKLPEEIQVRVRTLSGEIRRSIMASQDGDTDTNCSRRIVLWGRADVHQDEVAGLSQALNTTVETLDPFSLVDIEPKLRSSLPDHTGRLAPLIGLLDCDARNDQDLIDFLNPRRPPEPPSPVGRNLLIGAAAAALVGTIFFFGWKNLKDLDSDIAARQLAFNNLESGVKAADESIARTERVDNFLDGNVIWLEEIRRVAVEMPAAEDVILDSAIAVVGRTGGGSLTLIGNVTDDSVTGKFQASLRDENHSVVGKGGTVVSNKAPYNFTLNEEISVSPEFVRKQRLAAEDAALLASVQPQEEAPVESPEAQNTDQTPVEVTESNEVSTDDKPSSADDATSPSDVEPVEAPPSPTEPSEPLPDDAEPQSPNEPTEISSDEIVTTPSDSTTVPGSTDQTDGAQDNSVEQAAVKEETR